MYYLKMTIATVFVSLVALLGFLMFSYGEKYEEQVALENFLQGNYSKAEATIKRLERISSSPKYPLYLAYMYRAKSILPESNQYLSQALKKSKKSNDVVQLEIYLNQAYNNYLVQDAHKVTEVVAKASQIENAKGKAWIQFFRALSDYMNGNYGFALQEWQDATLPASYLSGWMKHSFEEKFTPLWLLTHILRADIEEQHYMKSRNTIELSLQDAPDEILPQLNYLLGLSYVKEAEAWPITVSAQYWKEALKYFDQYPIKDREFRKECENLINQIYVTAVELIKNGHLEDIPFYLHTLEKWNAKAEATAIASQLIEHIQFELANSNTKNSVGLLQTFNKIFPSADVRQSIMLIIEEELTSALHKGDQHGIQKYWVSLQQIHEQPNIYKEELLARLEGEMLEHIRQDDALLSHATPGIHFWISLQQDKQVREDFANKLFDIGIKEWEKGNSEKGFSLLKLTANLNESNGSQQKEKIEKELRRLYAKAQKENHLEQLTYFLKAVDELGIPKEDFQDPERISLLSEEAQELIYEGLYEQANVKLLWILQLEPENEKARKLLDMTLTKIEKKDSINPEILKAQLSYIQNLIELALDKERSSNHLQEARILLSKFLKANQENAKAYFTLGQVMFLLDDNQEAIKAYWNAIRLDSSNVDSYKDLSLVYSYEGNLVDALIVIKNGLKLAPQDVELWKQLNYVFKLSNMKSPIAVYTHLYQVDPDLAETVFSKK